MTENNNCVQAEGMKTVASIMNSIISVGSQDNVFTASKIMADKKIGSILIVQDNSLIGIVTAEDLTRKVLANQLDPSATKLCDIMSNPLVTIPDNSSFEQAAGVMSDKTIKHLIVTSNGTAAGIISETDVLKALSETSQEQAQAPRNNSRLDCNVPDQTSLSSSIKNNFLAGLSHEIRTPLNAIIGLSEVLAEEKLTDEQINHLTMIRESAKHMRFLLNDIMDYSKIEAGQFNVEINECSLEHLLAVIESLMRPKAIEKDLDFGIFHRTQLPAIIRTDHLRLRQCLMNLVNNAIDFTDKGHVHLNISLEQIDNKPHLKFDVEDTGAGIPAEDLEKIFEHFSQPAKSSHRTRKGTGLGLAITSKLANLLGGNVTVTSKVGFGTTFSLIIPTGLDVTSQVLYSKNEQINNLKNQKPGTEQSLFTGRVLVAEDTPTNQTLIRILLEKMGLNVVITPDGNEAVKTASQQDFDIVLMDIQMPHLNGYDATKQLRKQGFNKPIIAVTAHAMHGDREKCLEAGCNDYLPKPIDRNHLTEILTKYLTKASDMNEKIDSVKNQVHELTQMCSPESNPIMQTPGSNETLPADQLIDWVAMINICDDESVIKQVVEMYRNDSPKCLQSLAEAIKSANPKFIKMYAHSLKGASMQIGAKRLGDIAYKLECAGRDKDMEHVPELFNEVQDEFSKLMLFLSQPNWMELAKKAHK